VLEDGLHCSKHKKTLRIVMLEGVIRESTGKSATKKLRRDGYLIANVYGKGVENRHCAFRQNDFIRAAKAKTTLLMPIKIGEETYQVVIQEYQKDPVYNDLLHVDLMVATEGVSAHYLIPVAMVGTPVGLKNKGVLITSKRRIKVKSAPENLPDAYTLDVSPLDTGDNILVRDLPEIAGVTIMENPSVAVVGVIKAK
jgi:large subunit ribosomal protein L25